MNILIFNWRDIKNPRAGGAEVVTHEVAKRWVNSGHTVTLFTAFFKGGLKEEIIDGVNIIRQGKQWTVHCHAFLAYFRRFKGRVDVVIDEVNTIPFFTPWYVKEKKILYINQLAKEVWFYEAPLPLNFIGFWLEKLYLKIYRKTKTVTISVSTKTELKQIGINQVEVIPMAVDFNSEQKFLTGKEKSLTIIFVGRLVASKRPDQAIFALKQIKEKIPNACLWLVGGCEERFVNKLKLLVRQLGLVDNVHFWGFLSQEKKYELMSRAHLIVVTSIKEGWGLIVTEANALKTPGVVYNVSGLRDAVRNNQTGLVVEPNFNNLAEAVVRLWKDKLTYRSFQEKGVAWSRDLTWDKTAAAFLEAITK